MEDIIVLLLTIVFLVASFLGQSKKRKQSGTTPVKQSGTAKQEDSFWKTFGLEEKDLEEKRPVVSNQEFVPSTEGGRVDRFHPKGSQMRREFLPKKENEAPISVSVFKRQQSNFPLRKAVIYSEILNRKYF